MLFSNAELSTRVGSAVSPDVYGQVHDHIAALIVLEGQRPYTSLSGAELDAVRGVAIAAAARQVDNPLAHQSETSGNYSYSLGAGTAESTFLPDERRILQRAYGITGGSYSIALDSPADSNPYALWRPWHWRNPLEGTWPR